MVHLILSAIVVFASLASSQLGVLCSLVVAVIVTLLSASFVFVLIEDADVEQRGLRGIRFAPRYIMRSVTVGSVEKVGVEPDPKRVGPASWNLEYG